jgi:hypothetical protein
LLTDLIFVLFNVSGHLHNWILGDGLLGSGDFCLLGLFGVIIYGFMEDRLEFIYEIILLYFISL